MSGKEATAKKKAATEADIQASSKVEPEKPAKSK